MRKFFRFLLIIIFLGGIGFICWSYELQPADSSNYSSQIFTITPGEGVKQIGTSLESKGLIKNSLAFYLFVKQSGIENKIQAGDFQLSPSLSLKQIANKLTANTLDIWVTISEGKRAEEIADLFESKLPHFSQSWRKALDKEEGYLFPDTYLIPHGADIKQIVSLMKNNFAKKYASIDPNPDSKLSQQEIVTIASMVEREARFPDDQPLVASVILNRLNLGMPLQIDSTIQYALGYQTGENTWWKKKLTLNDLEIDSPYNTYTQTGLPPTPIANPGLGALKAAVHPADTSYLYYISDKYGHNHYAKTLSEQNANIQKYE